MTTDILIKGLTEEKIKSIDTPFIMLLGGKDIIVDNKGAYNIYEKSKT